MKKITITTFSEIDNGIKRIDSLLENYSEENFIITRTSEDWSRECLVDVLDADGWDRSNFHYSWYEELITKYEFENRLINSTCRWPSPTINDKGEVVDIWR
jgi:hypothetical protein